MVKLTVLMGLLLASLSCSAANSSFQTYWSQFRAASLAKDYATLSSLTKLPLEVKGVVDNSPVKSYDKNQLVKIFPQLLSQTVYQTVGEEFVETTMEDLIKKKEKVTFNATDTEIRVDQFQFKLIDGKWFLIRAYLEE